MDFGNAVMLSALVLVFIQYIKSLVPTIDPRVTQTLVLLAGIAAVFLASTTVWAHEQVIGKQPLDNLNTGSKIVAGIFLGALSSVGFKGLQAVRNIGQNDNAQP